jgi:protein-S-isoprenylcysteine O-methyltransferase Ste14
MNPFLQWDIPHILFYAITVLWLMEFIVFPSKHQGGDYQEKRSFYLILLTIVSNVFITLLLTYYGTFQIREYPWSLLKYLGLSFYVMGIALRYTASILLGQYFSRDVHVEKDQVLVSHGPYRILRHPLYLGLFLLVTAVPVFFQNPVAITFALFSMGRILNQRMELEEKNMEKVLGDTYRKWKKQRYRFIPFIY